MFEEDMIARLDANAPLAAKIGRNVFPYEAPPDQAPPYLVYRLESTEPDDTLSGASVHRCLYMFEAHARTYRDAKVLGDALKDALDNWRDDPPAPLMSMTFAGAHDGPGAYSEEARQRRTFSRELAFEALLRA